MEHLERNMHAYAHQQEETILEILALDSRCSECEKTRRAAISGRRHQEAGRLRVEFDRFDALRRECKEHADELQRLEEEARVQQCEVRKSIATLNEQIKNTGNHIQLLQRQIDGGLITAPRPPKHVGTRALVEFSKVSIHRLLELIYWDTER